MKKALFLIIFSYCIFCNNCYGANDMGLQRFDHTHTLVHTLTENNAIGPTTSLTLRTLDNATPLDANSIFLSPDTGVASDGNAGTQAAPVLTFEKAVDLVQASGGAKLTIHIERNAFVGAMVFITSEDHGSGNAIPDNTIIQVELGEIAEIQMFNQWGDVITSISGMKLNGLIFTKQTEFISAMILLKGGSTEIKFCEFTLISLPTPSFEFIDFEGSTGNIIKNCIFNGNNVNFVNEVLFLGTTNIDDSIFCNFTGVRVGVGLNRIENGSIEHCTFHNNNTAIEASLANNIIVKNCIFSANSSPFETGNGDITLSFSLLTNNSISSTVTQGSGILLGILPLFFDQPNEDFRLMDQRRTAPDSEDLFTFTSQAVENSDISQTPSDDGRDLGPFDVSYVLVTDEWIEFEMDNEFWNDPVNIQHNLINYQPFQDIRGNHRRSFDGMRRKLLFKADNINHVSTLDSYKLRELIRAPGSKRWFPLGDDGVFTEPSGIVTVRSDGDFDATIPSIELVNQSFEGYIVEASGVVGEFELRVRENSSGTLVLEDHRGNQASMSSGTFNLKLSYLPIEIDMPNVSQHYEMWDPKENPLIVPESGTPEHWEGHIREIIVRETEEDE